MNKELSDRAWRVLPAEFKEEVRKMRWSKDYTEEQVVMIRLLFGDHNLTSDAEREEMLIVSRKEIQHFFKSCIKHDERMAYWDLLNIFGAKCLPDDLSKNSSEIKRELSKNSSESNPAEPTENKADEIADKAINPIEEYFDNIIKDGFREHNRLHIASIIMSWLLASGKEKHPVRRALDLADALIAEAAKGESK